MIKRTRSESARVAHLVHRTPTPYVECRAEGRHALGKRVIAVHLVPGERDATVRRTCRECGTVRVEQFRVRVNRDRVTLVFLDRLGTPQYRRPVDYPIDATEPQVTRLDWLAEAVNRDARNGGAEVVELRPAAAS